MEFWVSFTDRCPLLPNRRHILYIPCPSFIHPGFSRLLKAWHTHCGYLDFLCSTPFLYFFLCHDSVLICTGLPFLLSLCEDRHWDSYWLLKRLHCAFNVTETVCVSCCERRNSTTLPVVQGEVTRTVQCFVWLQSWCVCFFPLPSHLTPPLHYYPFPLCSGDWVQKDIRPHYSITNAVSAINAHTRFMPQDNCGREGWVTGNIQLYSMTVDVFLHLYLQSQLDT